MDCIEATTVTLFVEKRLPRDQASVVEEHLDGCTTCRRLISELARDHAVGAELGDRIDRYVLLRVVGSGGMGTVYAAYDPTLDRKVAIKVLRTPDAAGRTRLIGEARAMARVSSRNVVAVHDAGVVGDEVYVSMELVGGGTLRAWMRERRHGWREVVRVFAAAGRGLAAAHDGGLVHRDFKPENVLLDGDRVCVADFGLAAPLAARITTGDPADVDHPLTITGAVVGTPAYMAPEQLTGDPVDARSDQFSFCVAMHEALAEERPFAGATLDGLAAEILAGRIRALPRTVPAWLRAIVARGLAAEPSARYPTMHALLHEVARRRARRRLVAALGGGIVTAAIGTAVGASYLAPAFDPCEAAGVQLAVHDAAAIRRGLAGFPDGPATAERVIASFDAWRTEAGALRASTCKASRVAGTESEQLADLRGECIADSARRVAVLGHALAEPPPALAEGAAAAVERAVDLSSCRGRRAQLEPLRPPDDPAQRAEYDALRTRLAVARTANDAGRHGDGVAAATAVATDAARSGFRTLESDAWAAVGRAEQDGNQPLAARDVLQRALLAAEAAGDERGRATIDLQLANVETKLDRDADAARLIAQARAIAERVGDDGLRWQLAAAEGWLAAGVKDHRETLAAYQAALAARGDKQDLTTAVLLQSISGALALLGRFTEAEPMIRRAIALDERLAGPRSPTLIEPLTILGTQLFMAGRATESVAALERAFAIAEAAPGRGHAQIPQTLMTLAVILTNLRRTPEALRMLDRAKGPIANAFGERSSEYANLLESRARALQDLGRLDEASTDAIAAVAIARTQAGPDRDARGGSALKAEDELATALETLAIVQRTRGAHADEIANYTEALAIETRLGHSTFDDEVGLGEAYILTGRYTDAIPHMDRAIALRSAGSEAMMDPVELADAKVNLAQALLEIHRERARAITLLHEARAVYTASDHAAEQLQQVNELLAKIAAPGASTR